MIYVSIIITVCYIIAVMRFLKYFTVRIHQQYSIESIV